MTSAAGMLQDQNLDKQIERQMGCMAGFLHLFDRHHLLTAKRLYSAKRLPPPPSVADSVSESGKSSRSPPASNEPATTSPTPDRICQSSPDPAPETRAKAAPDSPMKTPPPMSVFEIKEGTRSSWKFREAPRLSLDSRATTDANGSLRPKQIRTTNHPESPGGGDIIEKQRKSTGVIARLMGLEPLLPSSLPQSTTTPFPQLRRSASESRVTRDPFQCRLADAASSNYHQKSVPTPHSSATGVPMRENAMSRANQDTSTKPPKCETFRSVQRRNHLQQRNYYDSADFFPEPKQQTTVSVYGEMEKRLKMSGIDGSSKDLETLKHILEALQLKGLLHSKESADQRNFVYDRNREPPIVVMKPSRSPYSGTESPPPSYRLRAGLSPRRKHNVASECLPSASSPRRERFDCDRNSRVNGKMRNSVSPTRSESSMKSSNLSGRKQCNVEQRSASPEQQQRLSSPVNSPKPSFRRSVTNQASSPRNRRYAIDNHPAEKTLFPVSDESYESSISNSSQSDSQRVSSGSDEYKEGKSLLSRCDKLLQSIAEMNSTTAPQQPSPVSVLDPSFYKEDELSSSSPSPVLKRSIDFKDLPVDLDEEELSWTSCSISTVDGSSSDDSDFFYVADVLRALTYLPDEPDVFPLLEKQQFKRGKDASKTSALNRKLIFDNVSEIVNKKRQLPPWKAISSPDLCTDSTSLPYIWSEFKKIRERDESCEELFQVICGVLKKDMAANSVNGCGGEWQVEVGDWVLDMERMIFKDLIGDTIRDLGSSCFPCRKLSF